MSDPFEVHVEHLLGKRVVDADGKVVGRIEEMRVDVVDGEMVVTEWHLGPAGLYERLGGAALHLPFVRALGRRRRSVKIPWQLLDLSWPDHPRLRCTLDELESGSTETGTGGTNDRAT